jgi:predicted outer membrane protein
MMARRPPHRTRTRSRCCNAITSGSPPADNAELDRVFVDKQIAQHERTIEMFRRQSTGARDAELRELAARALPRLERHLEALRKLDK